jgi:transposase
VISFNGRTKVFAATEPVDLRKSFDTLFAYCRDRIKKDPLSGHVFLFINKDRDRLKALFWDGTGLVLICKRLEVGRFTLLNRRLGDTLEMSASEFALLFEGSDLNKRFINRPGNPGMVESPKKYKELHP